MKLLEIKRKSYTCFFLYFTLIYELVPTNVSATELISCPDTPKSHNLICPCEFTNTLDGFKSIICMRVSISSLNKEL